MRERLFRILRAVWRAVDVSRRVAINVLFLVLIAVSAAAWIAGSARPKIAPDTALVLDLRGNLVEQYTGSAREAELEQTLGGQVRETQLRDVTAVLDAAAKDPRIPRAVLVLEDMGDAGLAKLHEIAAAMTRFQAHGKKIIAWSTSMDQRQYLLAMHADEVYLDPFGALELHGFGGYRNYYHQALDRLGVHINVFRVGKYKSFVEPFTRDGPSPDADKADASWLGDAWAGTVDEIEAARHLPPGTVADFIDHAPERLQAAQGSPARMALAAKLVDGLKTREQLRAMLIARGKPDPEQHSFRQISMQDYENVIPDTGSDAQQVGIIVAEGTITDGDEPQGSIGGRSTAELIRKAREDKSIKAIVLRVDSGGGSAFGSELIRRELALTRAAGKPVVVSMSDVAASGGYWITTASNRVLADPGTITGSIGVFGILPTVDGTLGKLGIHTGGTTTTWLAGAADLRRPLDPRLGGMVQETIGYMYRQFLERVGHARHLPTEQVDAIAQGRVWTGRQARARRLVDGYGNLEDAVHAAAEIAKLRPGYGTTYIEAEPTGWGHLLTSLPAGWLRATFSAMGVDASWFAPISSDAALARVATPAGTLHVLADCLCQAP